MPQIWEMPTAAAPLTGLERLPMNQGGGLDAVKNAPLLTSGAPFGGAVLLLDAGMLADLAATTDADPGAGSVRWNNADPDLATELYVSDEDADANDVATALAGLAPGGFFYLQGSADGNALGNLQRWQVTSATAGSGYSKLAVTLQASSGAFSDDDTLWMSVQQPVPTEPGALVIVLSGTAYDMGDLTPGAWHVFTAAGAVTVTVEDDSVEPVPSNAEYGLEARGAGGVTLVEDSAATILPPKGGTLALETDDFAVLKRIAADDYRLVGSTVAAP